MKKLNLFTHFDFNAFAKGKKFLVVGQKPWADYNSGEVLGTKVEIVITEDKTDYGISENEITVNNLYEKFIVKISKDKNVTVELGKEVRLINPRGSVYGDYRNQLSVTADGLQVVR